MANPDEFLPLYETIMRKRYGQRILDVFIFLLLLSLVLYRLLHIAGHGASLPWVVACFSEVCFAFFWLLAANCKWSPVNHVPFSHRLQQRVPEKELPPVDLLVTTADPVLEPPIITINTVLSLLAVDYPTDKLACYVSDDGCSAHTCFSLVEASRFARLWIPFCRRYDLQVRAPLWYFAIDPDRSDGPHSVEFRQDWNFMKGEYEKLTKKVEDASRRNFPSGLSDDFAVFSGAERKNHPTIIKVIWENKEGLPDGVPHLIYVSREKRPKQPPHYKAGALNVLTRVSGVMTNAPFMLNVDCDMHVNNPGVVRQAMCFFFGAEKESDCAFVQSPQAFYDLPASEMNVWNEFIWQGIAGIQGPFYIGTGCFHRRKVIYGLSPEDVEDEANLASSSKGILAEFGSSKDLVRSAFEALRDQTYHSPEIYKSIEAAHQVASCNYEDGTGWGTKFGFSYGSTAEDINTGLKIHSKGWKTLNNAPAPPAFLGSAPPPGPSIMVQQRRWATGALEILLSRNSPVLRVIQGRLWFRQCLAYLWLLVWGLRPLPELSYTLLPAYCIITNSHFLPKLQDPFFCLPLVLFSVWNLQTISEYLKSGVPISVWWATQGFNRIKTTGPWLLSIPNIILKLLGLSDAVFEVTRKTMPSSNAEADTLPDPHKFVFDDSVSFVPGLAILLVHMVALVGLAVGPIVPPRGCVGAGLGEVSASLWVVISYWAFLRGLFETGRYGIPTSTIIKSSLLAFIFVQTSRNFAAWL